MTSADIVRIARQRANLTQQQLADRSGHPRESIARWETGSREPSLATLRSLVDAAGLDLVIHLARGDPTLDEAVLEQLGLAPRQRLQRLLSADAYEDAVRTLRWLARARTQFVLIGGIAAALQGAPQRPANGAAELVSADTVAMDEELRAGGFVPADTDSRWAEIDARAPWTLPAGGVVSLAENVPGTAGYADLRRNRQTIELDPEVRIAVAHPRDLLRIADASPHAPEQARVPGLRALLRHADDKGR